MSEEKKKSYTRYKDYKALLAIAETCRVVKGQGLVSRNQGKDLFEAIKGDGKYSDAEKAAMAYIRENYSFTDAGQTLLKVSLRDWALERGRQTQADKREEE